MSEQIESVSPASWIRERDIDLLVVEEFRASSTFRDLLLNALNLSIDHVDGANISAQISVEAAGTGAGETDVECTISTGDRTVRILIENKIDAIYQPFQLERYRQRANALRERGIEAYVLLLAPESYDATPLARRESPLLADDRLNYEELRTHLVKRADATDGELRARLQVRADVVDTAIKRAATGYVHHVDEVTTAFWKNYAEFARDRSPQLTFKSGDRARTSTFLRFTEALFQVEGLERVRLIHKLRGSEPSDVDIQIAGLSQYANRVAALIGPRLPPNARVATAQKSLVIRTSAPPIDHTRPLEDIKLDVLTGIQIAATLMEWWNAEGANLVANAVRICRESDLGHRTESAL